MECLFILQFNIGLDKGVQIPLSPSNRVIVSLQLVKANLTKSLRWRMYSVQTTTNKNVILTRSTENWDTGSYFETWVLNIIPQAKEGIAMI